MAKIFHEVGGKSIANLIAHHVDVHEAIHVHTEAVGVEANALKRRYVDTGASFIEVDFGEVDGIVTLNDTLDQRAALSMEYGSAPHEGFPDGTPAQRILHDAARLPLKSTFPRSRRRKKLARQTVRRR